MRIRVLVLVGSVVAPAVVLGACRSKPSIDGSGVPKIGSEAALPECPEVCDRLAALCGYAPGNCVEGCADYDDEHRLCIGQASSCQEALQSCVNAPEPDAGDDAEADATDDGSTEDEAGGDAGDDAESDAADD